MSKSTNKTSAAIERLAKYGNVEISKGPVGGWGVCVPTGKPFETGDTLDEALNAALRKLEGGDDR